MSQKKVARKMGLVLPKSNSPRRERKNDEGVGIREPKFFLGHVHFEISVSPPSYKCGISH